MTQVNMEKLQQSIIRLHKLEAQIEDVAANKETKSEQAKPEPITADIEETKSERKKPEPISILK